MMRLLAIALLLLSATASAAFDAGDCAPAGSGPRGLESIDDLFRRHAFPVTGPDADSGASGSALKSELLEKMSHGRIQLSYSQSRRFLFEHSIDSTGHVWDVYGQREARTPGGNPDVEDVNVEHTWPQSRFHTGWASVGKHRDDDPMKADLHNLYPTDNRLNGLRGNKPFGEVPGCDSGKSCDAAAVFEPPDAHKGNAARAIFYMSVRYGLAVPAEMEATLKLWNKADPVDAAETRRNDDIQTIQGNRNAFIDDASLVDRISDF